MTVTVEISMYPLVNDYEDLIIPFIKKLRENEDLLVKTNAMSTYVQGPFDRVWSALHEGFKDAFSTGVPMSNVIKIIPRDLPLEEGWLKF